MKRLNWLILAFGAMAFSSVALVGCGDDEQVACEEDMDCAGGEICLDGTCALTGCFDADDCNQGEGCSGGQCPEERERNVCFLPCESDDDCGGSDVCNLDFCGTIIPEGRCVAAGTPETCLEDDDCDDGLFCNEFTESCIAPGGACLDNLDCVNDQVCEDEVCVDSGFCAGDVDCYDRGNFFCDTEAETCKDTSCGEPGNTCSQCTSGENGGDREDGGPVIFLGEQIDLAGDGMCQADSDRCAGEATTYCEFSFFFFDPDDDFDPTNDNLWVVNSSGQQFNTFGVAEIGSGVGKFGACFRPDQSSVGTAIFVKDTDGNASNTLCVNGVP